MTPTNDGRLCDKCSKNIVDFTNKKWSEIEKIQNDNNNSVCGMYSEKQLKFWGQDAPFLSPNKAIVTSAIVLGLTAGSVFSQTPNVVDTSKEKTIIKGTVTGIRDGGIIDTLGFTDVFLSNHKINVVADENGQYEIDITEHIDTAKGNSLVFSFIGYDNLEIQLEDSLKGNITLDPQLIQNNDNVGTIAFSIKEPTYIERIKYRLRLKDLFRKKK